MTNEPPAAPLRSPASRGNVPVSEWKIVHGAHAGVVLFPDRQLILQCSTLCAERLLRGEEHLLSDERQDWDRMKAFASSQPTCADHEARLSPTDGYHFALNLNLTDACNLACTYCFADGGSYRTLRNVSMQSDVVPHVRALVRALGGARSRIEFFGGEPLLRFPLIAELTRALSDDAKVAGTAITFRISTNLTVLDTEMIELFARHGFVVSVSIDGTRSTHDRNRPGKDGATYHATILRNVRRLREASEHLTIVARVTATGGDGRLWDEIQALNDLALFDWFQVLPVTLVRANGSKINEHFEELYAKYHLLFEANPRLRGNLETEYVVNLFQTRRFAPAFCSAGRTYFALAQDRRLYPCHRLLGDARFACGDAKAGPAMHRLSAWNGPDHRGGACGACWMRHLCSGGCKHDHLVKAGRLESPSREFCMFQELTCSAALRTFADRLDRERDRTEELSRLFVSCGRPSAALGAWTSALPQTATFTVVDPSHPRIPL